jgi:ABC-2 type transport system ATP-binding protein
LFGKGVNPDHIEKVLKSLSLWDKKDTKSMELSGGMKRRALIAKALAHEPDILFLDEPTAGVDVELRQDMWSVVKALRDDGVTVILTTHYIEEAEQLADRVGVINNGEIILVEEKDKLMREMGKKQLMLHLYDELTNVPLQLSNYDLELSQDRRELTYTYDTKGEHTGITDLINDLRRSGIRFNDLQTSQSSLEDIFVDLVHKGQ